MNEEFKKKVIIIVFLTFIILSLCYVSFMQILINQEKIIKEIEVLSDAFTLDNSLQVNVTKSYDICEAYSNLTTIRSEIKTGTQYYFIDNRWVEESILWNNCLYGE